MTSSKRNTSAVVPSPPMPQPSRTRHRGTAERRASAWLGRAEPASLVFENYRHLDRLLMSNIGQLSGGISTVAQLGALHDWCIHWLSSPAKQLELWHWSIRVTMQTLQSLLLQAAADAGSGAAARSLPQDKRFSDPAWEAQPFNTFASNFLLVQEAWRLATEGVPGVSRHHEDMVEFGARQWLDMLSPSNFIATNPVVLQRTLREGGLNLLRGTLHAAQDLWREASNLPPAGAEAFEVGRNLAVTPGQVIHRNRLAELIQYKPTTAKVRPEPVLLMPAWIMKYYIVDLSPHNSMVKALRDEGFTVFVLSWKNPGAEDRDTGIADYHHLGIEDALDAIGRVLPDTPVHAVGYCLGGTLLAMAAAALARPRPKAFKSLTLLAAQTDFSDPGELGLFIDAGQVEMLDDMMWREGVLSARQMKGTFQMLRSQDLLWSYRLFNYLLGERRPMTDLMAWNADGTRLPYRMHCEYLHTLFLDNALARGQARLDGVPISLASIRVPIFNVGTVQDHVAPWRSVFKLHALTDAEQTFCLTAGGHNVGIVNPPDQLKTSYRLRRWCAGEWLLTPDQWLQATAQSEGSWWTPWFAWLHEHSGAWGEPPPMGVSLQPAPGRYVMQR
jgi:polyhydroxyalkanoate synthase subunit PhaC